MTPTSKAPRKLFDRSVAGAVLDPVRVDVEARAVQLFADTLGFVDADQMSGQSIGLPTFFTFVDAEADRLRRRRGEPTILALIGASERYLLHGEESYELVAPIRAGDRLTVSARIAGFRDSSDDRLEFADIEQSAASEDRGLLVRARRTYIHKFL